MFGYDGPGIAYLLIAVAFSYFIGALPLADRVSRRRGVDIFSAGTGLAGSTNVLKNVGVAMGAIVFLGDIAKGVIAIFVSQQFLGVQGAWIVVPAASAVVGQWNSVFTGFRGGDGLVVLGGATLVAFPIYGFIGVVIAAIVALVAQRMPFSSLLNILAGYSVIILLVRVNSPQELTTALAMGALGILVFAHALFGHSRRNRAAADGCLAGSEETATDQTPSR